MIRRFNYTDRQKIPRANVQLAWSDTGDGVLRFQGELDLQFERPLNPAGLVFVEAYSGPVVMRFAFGSVEHREHPADVALTEFPPGLKPLFRVKVVDPADDKRLLAWADAVTPLTPDEIKTGRRSILPVETVDLGQRVWDLRIEANTFFLQLNSSIRQPDITVLAREPDFIGLVYPVVVRQILHHLLLGPEVESVDDDHDWLVFGTQLVGRTAPKRSDDAAKLTDDEAFETDVNEWIQEAVSVFCERQRAAELFIKSKSEAEEQNV